MLDYLDVMVTNVFVDILSISAQLWSRLLSESCPNNGGDAVNVFQSNLKGIFVDDCSRYLASRLFGKLKGKGVGEI